MYYEVTTKRPHKLFIDVLYIMKQIQEDFTNLLNYL